MSSVNSWYASPAFASAVGAGGAAGVSGSQNVAYDSGAAAREWWCSSSGSLGGEREGGQDGQTTKYPATAGAVKGKPTDV